MRWRDLFDDLEGQLVAAEATALDGEVADRSRREAALVHLRGRLAAATGRELGLQVLGAGLLRARLLDTGPDWLLLEENGAELLVPMSAVLGVTGVVAATREPDTGAVALRLDLRWALRGLARSRTGVVLCLVDGSLVTGTLDRVGADHVDVAEHGRGEARRAGAVRQVRLVPLRAIAVVRSG